MHMKKLFSYFFKIVQVKLIEGYGDFDSKKIKAIKCHSPFGRIFLHA